MTPPCRHLLLAAAAFSLVSVACASAPPLPEDVKDPPRIAYHRGMARLVAGDYLRASEIFQKLSEAPRHVRHAALARLRHGDALYLEGRYAEAAEIYRSFASQHRGNPNLAYARFRVAASYFKRLPGEWLLSPPDHEMDQTLTQQAENELTGFLSLFPTSPFATEARAMLKATRTMLLDHERYAARFNARNKAWAGVVTRLTAAFERFPELVTEADGWRLVEAAERAGPPARTVELLSRVAARFPDSPRRAELARRLASAEAALKAVTPESDDGLPDLLDAPPDFRLKLPGSVEPEGATEDADGPETDSGAGADSEETDEDEDGDVDGGDSEDEEAPPRLRPPTLPSLIP